MTYLSAHGRRRAAPPRVHCTRSTPRNSSFASCSGSCRTDRAGDDAWRRAKRVGARRSEGASGARWPGGQARAVRGPRGEAPARTAYGLTSWSVIGPRVRLGAPARRHAAAGSRPGPRPGVLMARDGGMSGPRRPSPERARASGARPCPGKLRPRREPGGALAASAPPPRGDAASAAFPPRPSLRCVLRGPRVERPHGHRPVSGRVEDDGRGDVACERGPPNTRRTGFCPDG